MKGQRDYGEGRRRVKNDAGFGRVNFLGRRLRRAQ